VLDTADMAIASGGIVGNENGILFIRARNVSLKSVVASLQKDFAVDINGLESLENDKITFVFEASSLEELVKGLLQYFNIKNYAFEFADDKLRIVTVVPGSKRSTTGPVYSDSDSAKREETVTVAVIKSIVESSQAETLDLMQGDFIVEYDGIRINSAAQLVKEVKKKSAKSQIEMIVVRDQTSRRLILQGGVIGVRITTEKVSKQEYLNYF
jgi:predicted metalloprotease with PDZ domain